MKKYRVKRTYKNGDKHIVYYIRTEKNIPCSLGWDKNELEQIIKEKQNLSIFIGPKE